MCFWIFMSLYIFVCGCICINIHMPKMYMYICINYLSCLLHPCKHSVMAIEYIGGMEPIAPGFHIVLLLPLFWLFSMTNNLLRFQDNILHFTNLIVFGRFRWVFHTFFTHYFHTWIFVACRVCCIGSKGYEVGIEVEVGVAVVIVPPDVLPFLQNIEQRKADNNDMRCWILGHHFI